MRPLSLRQLYSLEFAGYSSRRFLQDLFAGLTVAAVALPLALAFGVASGATAAAGLVTAVLAGILIGGLSGAPYQISGPTGAMSAILIVLAQRYGIEGVWIAGFLSGVILLVIGALRLGRFIAFIPAPVITGFTSGIAIIIAIGQIDNILGIASVPADSALAKLFNYFTAGIAPNWYAVGTAGMVIGLMLAWPQKWNAKFPASLFAIILATTLEGFFAWPIATIGEIPSSLVLDARLSLEQIPWNNLKHFIAPAVAIAALGGIESLLCGAVGSNMTGKRLHANQELIAQGVGNIIIPFFGGVPATAAIARSSVGIKAGGHTRLVSIVHALAILLAMFLLGPIIEKVPLAALAGVLVVTAWRMNEWEAIHFYFSRRLPTAMVKYGVTLIATVTLDLTYAILIGFTISAALFLNQVSQLDVNVQDVDKEKLLKSGVNIEGDVHGIKVAYLTGPIFFAAIGHLVEAFKDLHGVRALILSMRGVPTVDSSGLKALSELAHRLHKNGGLLVLAGVTPNVQALLERGGFLEEIGTHRVYWGADQAILETSNELSARKHS